MANTPRANDKIVNSVEAGSIVADVLRGTTSDGHTYLYYQVSRAWRPQNGTRRNYSARFYERNEKDHKRAIELASAWIRKNAEAADSGWTTSEQQQVA